MGASVSPRLLAIVGALPLAPSMRVLEIGCGPGAAQRRIAAALTSRGRLFIDGGNPLCELPLPR